MQLELEESDANKATIDRYKHQMDILLHNIFPNREYAKKSPLNWIKSMTNIVGGKEHQHPHADQGRAQSFRDQTTYPFVATHGGFGRYPFQLWILPRNVQCDGYLETLPFSAMSLFLMRGHFVHAGGVSKDPRCHMSFYPLPAAGLVHDHAHHYWLEDVNTHSPRGSQICHIILVAGTTFPFCVSFRHTQTKFCGSDPNCLIVPT
jgi:hypothetical protein